MVAMEQLEIHSKSYLIRWVKCAPNYTISWSIKPHKKSLNFGIFKHPGQDVQTNLQSARPDASQRPTSSRGPKSATEQSKYDGDCIEKLHGAGLLDVYWHGKCDAEKVTTGTYQVTGQGGMFALVFDNTFSKQLSKIVTVIIMTYPSNNPPPASHHLNYQDTTAISSASSVSASQQKITPSPRTTRLSVDSETLPREDPSSVSVKSSKQGSYTGILKKRKRKRHQGYARRYFSLDYTTATLSYYMNQNSSALRGAIPLSLAAISASEKDREICIDSGAEVWHLRADNQTQWEGWNNALERAAEQAQAHKQSPLAPGRTDTEFSIATVTVGSHQVAEDRGWAGVEALVGRVAGVRDAVRRLAITPQATLRTDGPSSSGPPSEGSTAENTPLSTPPLLSTVTQTTTDKRPFWKRKASGTQPQAPVPAPSTQGLHPTQADRKSLTPTVGSLAGPPPIIAGDHSRDEELAANLKALLADLDSVVADFSTLLNENKHRRWLHRKSEFVSTPIATSRQSFESTASEEFFDADDGGEGRRVGVLNGDSDGAGSDRESAEATTETSVNEATDDDSGDSEDESLHEPKEPQKIEVPPPVLEGPKDLSPLPLDPVRRRATVLASTVTPPSLIGFLRKNVGKDLSTIAMPVSANEPTSLVQRLAEQLEYSEVLDAVVSAPKENGERILHITAFAISGFSGARLKERAVRKPFNPMLGETFELVREDKGFRFLAEKVSHRPVIMACHADAKEWTFTQSPMPTQKFWGKSAELNTSGRVRIHFPSLGEQYSYTIATSFLRNIIAGEKYVEPVGTMTVHCETTGEKAIATFKVAGMFSGRSEEVSVAAYDAQGQPYAYTLQGKWTESLSLFTDNSSSFLKKVWTVGSLVDQPNVRYGFTTFAAQLNEITVMEKGKMAPTDSRLRPDQRMVEEGRIDEAEEAKRQLEEKQRLRRNEMEEAREIWQPRWFVKVREYADEEVWRIKTKEETGEGGGYWEQRKEGKWRNVPSIF
ncbi:Oxysterol-binding protein-domain-containing protein [Terfezia claveryi]|nr:Oxysterol-binding protein-domain-containing protein [Terfezia claveryi]